MREITVIIGIEGLRFPIDKVIICIMVDLCGLLIFNFYVSTLSHKTIHFHQKI